MEQYLCELFIIFSAVFGFAFLFTLAIAYSLKKKLIKLLNRNNIILSLPRHNPFIVNSYHNDIEYGLPVSTSANNTVTTYAVLPNATAIAA